MHRRILIINGKKFNRIRYEEANDLHPGLANTMDCPDCACKKGEIHYFGCDMERCPNCGEQLLVCCCDIATEENTMCIIVQ